MHFLWAWADFQSGCVADTRQTVPAALSTAHTCLFWDLMGGSLTGGGLGACAKSCVFAFLALKALEDKDFLTGH